MAGGLGGKSCSWRTADELACALAVGLEAFKTTTSLTKAVALEANCLVVAGLAVGLALAICKISGRQSLLAASAAQAQLVIVTASGRNALGEIDCLCATDKDLLGGKHLSGRRGVRTKRRKGEEVRGIRTQGTWRSSFASFFLFFLFSSFRS